MAKWKSICKSHVDVEIVIVYIIVYKIKAKTTKIVKCIKTLFTVKNILQWSLYSNIAKILVKV